MARLIVHDHHDFDMRRVFPIDRIDIEEVNSGSILIDDIDQEAIVYGSFDVNSGEIDGKISGISTFGYGDSVEVAGLNIDASVLNTHARNLWRDLKKSFSGDDRIDGNQSDLFGDDYLLGYRGDDTVKGHGGEDTLVGGRGNDRLLGGDRSDRILGGPGNDTLDGGDFIDFVHGGGGDDLLRAGFKNTLPIGPFGREILIGWRGDDQLLGGERKDQLAGGSGDDTIEGRAANDRLIGGRGDDLLFGGPGNDAISSGAGQDQIDGGLGNDRLFGGSGIDEFIFDADSGDDTILRFDPDDDKLRLDIPSINFPDIDVEECSARGVALSIDPHDITIRIPSMIPEEVSESIFIFG